MRMIKYFCFLSPVGVSFLVFILGFFFVFFFLSLLTTMECRNNQINCPDSPALALARVKMSEQ